MKNVAMSFLIIAMTFTAAQSYENPMFGPNTQNAIGIHIAQGTGSGSLFKLVDPVLWDIVPMTSVMVQYSQPMEIFRLPARMNLNAIQNTAYRSAHGLSFFGIGVSWDIALIQWRGFYAGLGLGPYMRDSHDRYVESRLVFGEKVFIGKNIGTKWRGEIFSLHFSNGDFTETNHGFNFAGAALIYSF